jgi:serine/threonine protein kinase
MICPTCKASNAVAARFCSGCGVELRERNTLPPQTTVPEQEITRQHSGKAAEEATLVDRESDPLLGSTIAGKYRIDTKLGAGGMGAVYRATRLLIGDVVAVKILHSEQRDPTAPERFRREAQAAARLKHPNAVNIYDFGITDDGLQYLVMELVEGESLRRIIKQQGPVTPSASVEIANQICAALDEAHRHSIIHRDIKPDNIIVNVTATGLRVKVLDFGIAKLRDDVAGNLTQTGSILGTPHYMSPEQCLGEELDSRADIYSLGVVLYEMLTGTVPFNSPTPAAVVVQHVNQSPAHPRALNASIPESVESTVLHALEKRREDRPQSAGALAQELANAVRNPNAPVAAVTANGLANHFASTPTLVLNPQSFASGFATARNVERDTIGSHNRSNTTRVVGLTVLATVLLLGVGGLGVRMLLGTNGERTTSASDNLNAQRNESASVSQPSRMATPSAILPAPTVNVPPVNTSSLRNEVLMTLNGWAGAARAHDLDAQMSYYADVVDPYFLRHSVSAAGVRANRSVAYTKFTKLDVQLSNIDIDVDQSGTSATATFDKAYSFEGEKYLSGSVRSMLWLTKSGSRWLINGERDLKVYYVNK